MARGLGRTTQRTLVALLRAVNVGGTGKMSMRDLAAICSTVGFADVRTYIQSGNVVFRTDRSSADAAAALKDGLIKSRGSGVDVLVRDAGELETLLAANPFPTAPPAKVVVIFCSETVPPGLLARVTGPDGEQIVVCERELYVYYPVGIGASQLKLPKLPGVTTARNMNTVSKLVEICRELPPPGRQRA
ncbi:MAG: DUF1697 domain-containing protein [Vicinamibacterales bacterium]